MLCLWRFNIRNVAAVRSSSANHPGYAQQPASDLDRKRWCFLTHIAASIPNMSCLTIRRRKLRCRVPEVRQVRRFHPRHPKYRDKIVKFPGGNSR